MRPSPVISAIGSATLAFGLALSMAPGALAAPGPVPQNPVADDHATGMMDALKRDLDLTQAEAESLLEVQEAALDTDAEATEAAGDAYAGSLFDTDELTVLVTDTAAVEAVEATGADATVVSYGTEGLAEVVEDLNEASAQEGVLGWYPDVAGDTVVIEVLEGSGADVDAMVAEAGVEASAIQVVETDQAPRVYADIIGGMPFYTDGGRCAIGFAATNSAGQPGFVTAAHCGGVGTQVTVPPDGVGVFQYSNFSGGDIAFVRGISNFTLHNLVSRYNSGGAQAVTGTSQAPIGSAVCRSGSTTGWHCGTIQARNQTVSYPQGTVHGLTRTNVCAEPGDSGGPFVSGSQAQGVTSGGSGNCSSGGMTYYAELIPMVNSWGVSIYTG
ncbi:streptogrisin C [Nocardiopsis sp. Huas11]|uniref:S1 family peptidase n=1 Tax=Nocardiopsis sp. Huas11 TaxID=2183912 RepID=UPI000EAF8A21|nr:S1 family peptidase [Nocardiopsis sp. Huas11]RKS10275.1 streptogrisin C [Nocardiopsis sp. Huas11]